MKTIITLMFVLFISVAAQAQNATEVKADTVEANVALTAEVTLENKTEVARLYKFKNARIKKALKFSSKINKAKMA